MALLLILAAVGLFAYITSFKAALGSSLCAEIRIPQAVVTLGSPLRASCLLSNDCPLANGKDVRLEWRLGEHILSGNDTTIESRRASTVVIARLNVTMGYLTCLVCQRNDCQIVNGVEIKGGYPPSPPKKVSCKTNLTKPYTVTCQWAPGMATHLPTNYSLHTKIRQPTMEHKTYVLPAGVHSYTISRSDFLLFNEMEVLVTAANSLGRVSSIPLHFYPIESAKFDPPRVIEVYAEPHRYGCLWVRWSLSEHQSWVMVNLEVELRMKPEAKTLWTFLTQFLDDAVPLVQCNLLHGTEYHLQLRVRYFPGPWSEWSIPRTGNTLDKAPTGQLITWLKVSKKPSELYYMAQLLWKPSTHFRNNSKNVSYHIFLWHPERRRRDTVCTTLHRHCTFQLPQARNRLFITAQNSAGESLPTTVAVYQHRGLPPPSGLIVSPSGHEGLLVEWEQGSPDVLRYVIEWRLWSVTDLEAVLFDMVPGNTTTLLISAGIEPYRPYHISVYPVYSTGIGLPLTAEGYSHQKAPSAAPNLQVGDIHDTYVVLTWDSIPPEQRHGTIQNYTVYYWDVEDKVEAVVISPMDQKVVLGNLTPSNMYKALIEATNSGGSRRGIAVTFKTEAADVWSSVFSVVLACSIVILLGLCTVFFCFPRRKQLKLHFWPLVPDPANSSIRNWYDEDTLEEKHSRDIEEPVTTNISIIGFLEQKQEKCAGWAEGSCWLLGEQCSFASSHFSQLPREGTYGTVGCISPYRSQTQVPAYLRSDSTQPLLEEEPASPSSYLSVHQEDRAESPGQLGSVFWSDFPMLNALKVGDVEVGH